MKKFWTAQKYYFVYQVKTRLQVYLINMCAAIKSAHSRLIESSTKESRFSVPFCTVHGALHFCCESSSVPVTQCSSLLRVRLRSPTQMRGLTPMWSLMTHARTALPKWCGLASRFEEVLLRKVEEVLLLVLVRPPKKKAPHLLRAKYYFQPRESR